MNRLPRQLLPLLTALLAGAVVVGVGLWAERLAEERSLQQVRAQITSQVSTLRARLEGELNANAYLVTGLANYVATNPDIDRETFEQMASETLAPDSALRHITLAPDNVITLAYPLEGNEAAIGTDLVNHPDQGESVRRVMREQRTVVGGPTELVQGGMALIVRTPVYTNDDNYWGLASVPVRLDSLYQRAGVDRASETLDLAIRGHDGRGAEGAVFHGNPELFEADAVRQLVSFIGNEWEIAARPSHGWDAAAALPAWRKAALGGSALIAAMLGWLLTRQTLSLHDSERQFRHLVQGVNGVVLRWGGDGRIHFINAHGERLFGYQPGELVGRSVIGTIVPPRDKDGRDLVRLIQAIQHAPDRYALNENEVVRKDGSRRWMMWSNQAVRGTDGEIEEVLSIGHDHTRGREAELALRRVSRKLEAIVHALPDIGFVLDDQGLYVDVIGGRDSQHYPDADRLRGRTLQEVLPPQQAAAFQAVVQQAIQDDSLVTHEYTLDADSEDLAVTKGDMPGRQWFEARVYPLPPDVHERPAVVWLAYNVTERKQAEARIRHLALHDNLTGLANRRLLQDRLDQAIGLAHRHQERVALLFIDLDHFKPINDRHGHEFGDKVLCQVAERLQGLVRASDTVARYGGDEFVLLLQAIESAESALAVADKIVQAIPAPITVDGKTCQVGASVGVALYPDHGGTADELLRMADRSMYGVKQTCRGHYLVATP
ncbi:PAS domain S-box-containing protein/diguanylate cyclase (GGDEF)-like protein [Alkalispirillum mobile]|uniref:PAS domain S-box-containing protein/diguanylate cyclase (GGDEF)-like protein n=1 Tax=Alkalispirillum mobile TaxID=85925 RepID=A0A498C5N1_9GAMM|nr:diguanylate cyclase [Alkalispirillum mobile]RLK50952.1 PAS domain S-box-containing protein/diguanylate cyclase (GGDEF)-like protein [Alkalispirillum mobile]